MGGALCALLMIGIFCTVGSSSDTGGAVPEESFTGGIADGSDYGESEVETAGSNDNSPSYLTFSDITQTAYGIPDTPTAVSFSPQPIIIVKDAQDNTLNYDDGDSSGTDEVTLSLNFRSNPSASLGGTVTKAFTDGVADFSGNGLYIDKPGVYNLKVTASIYGEFVTGESNFFEIYDNTFEF